MSGKTTSVAGFQGSETTGVAITIYPHNDDLFIQTGMDKIEFTGSTERDHSFAITKVNTNKAMGAAAGTWSCSVKAPEHMRLDDFIVDDDWIDITFFKHGKPYHTMRGLIDTVREATHAGGEGGATSKTWTLSGKDFGSILEKTQIWFNRFAAENAGNNFTIDLFGSLNVGGPPNKTVKTIIYGFMETLSGLGRANWELPKAMPGAKDNFTDTFHFDETRFNNIPERKSVSTQLMDPNGVSIWGLAQEWSDPQFCELFVDLGRGDGGQLFPELTHGPADTSMVVYYRDIPFPTVHSETPFPNKDSAWFNLPLAEVSPFEISRKDIGRGGLDRYNTFMVSPQVLQSLGGRVDTQAPLWDPLDIKRHGLRKMEVQSRYVADEADLFTMSRVQRYMVRDWNVMNPYLYTGEISLGRLRPDIRIGYKMRIPGHEETENETYYVESVGHSWSLPAGGRTSLGVTRGYRGKDEKFLEKIKEVVVRYQLAYGKGLTRAERDTGIGVA